MYGSFAQGIGDRFSDIEFWLFTTDPIDATAWCERIAPTLAITRNEFGAHVVFFPDLIRGEFHFAPYAEIAQVATWPAVGAAPDDMIVVDRHGTLRPLLAGLPAEPEVPGTAREVEQLCLRFVNWLVLGLHVYARGEVLRAHDALSHVHRHLIWMARLDADGPVGAWLTPSRRAELELPAATATLLHAAHTGDAAGGLRNAWVIGHDLWRKLADRYGFTVVAALSEAIDDRVVQLLTDHHADIAILNSKSKGASGD